MVAALRDVTARRRAVTGLQVCGTPLWLERFFPSPLAILMIEARHIVKRSPRVTFYGLTRSSKITVNFFSWPSIHLFATLGKQMHVGCISVAYCGVACPAATWQGEVIASVMCADRAQRKVCFTEDCLILRYIAPELAPKRFLWIPQLFIFFFSPHFESRVVVSVCMRGVSVSVSVSV